jgi:hypothetical protein
MTCKRLNRQLPTDRAVSSDEFDEIWTRISNLVDSLAKNTRIKGFCDDDLKGFFAMKVHETLRRDKFDHNRSPFAFYKTNFDNLLKNLHKELENTEKKLYFNQDLLDFVIENEFDDQFVDQIVL